MRWSEDKESWQKVLEYTSRKINEKWSPDVKKGVYGIKSEVL